MTMYAPPDPLAPLPLAQLESPPESGVGWHRVAVGVLLVAGGLAWLADVLGASVPWRFAPAVGLVVVGVVLLASLTGGHGRGGVTALGVALLVAGIAVGVDVDRFAGPAGDVVVRPEPTEWPVARTLSAGQVLVRLDDAELPARGRAEIAVGAGRIELRVPADRAVRIEAEVVMGTVVVDGEPVAQGVDLQWSGGADVAPLVVVLEVGAGDVEVSHEQP